MAKLKIFKFPDIVLSQNAKPIERVEKQFFKLADDMLETMYDAPGVGLAANQVGVLEKILVIDTEYDFEELPEGSPKPENLPAGAEVTGGGIIKNRKPLIIINPEIVRKEGIQVFNEGCLSVPEFNAEIKRAAKLTLKYQTIDGLTKTLDAEGLLAVAIQHEMDHLEGKLFIDRLSPLKKEMIKKRLKQERAEREAEELELGETALLKNKKKKKEM